MITLILFIFSLVIVQLMTDHITGFTDNLDQWKNEVSLIQDHFDSVPHAMLSLFQSTTGGADWSDFYTVAARAGPLAELVFLFCIAFFVIVAWNIVMSTFVEKALKLATPDTETLMAEKRTTELKYAKQ